LDWSAIKLDVETDPSPSSPPFWDIRHDYKKFTVTDVNGIRYVFANRLRQQSSRPLKNHCDQPDNSHYYEHPYYYVFKLSAILGADYVDGDGDDIPGDGGTDLGSWIAFEYSTPADVIVSGYSPSFKMEVNYLYKIKTPTHVATFNVSAGGNYFIYQGLQYGDQTKILNSIELNPGNTKVEFFTSRSFGWVKELQAPQGILIKQEGAGDFLRMRLDSLRLSDSAGGMRLPAYKFEYTGDPAENHNTPCGLDPWGYYTLKPFETHPTEADVKWTAWLLQKVTYPTGSAIAFEYETNRYQTYYLNFRGSTGDDVVLGGGVRLKSQTITEPLTQQATIYQYDYALTNQRFPGEYGFLSAEPAVFDHASLIVQNSVGKNLRTEVHYPDVQITRMADGSKIRKYYTSAFSGVNGNPPAGQSYPPYYNYEYCYSTITVQTDVDLQAIPIGPGDQTGLYGIFYWSGTCPDEEAFRYFTNTSCYTSTATSTREEEAFRGEAKEFDDNVQVFYLNQGQVNAPLFYNGWKRGHLTCEELYESTGNSYLDGKPVQRKKYYYNLVPQKSEMYTVTAVWYEPNGTGHPSSKPAFVTSGWAQLVKVETEHRIAPNVGYLNLFDTIEYEHNSTNGLSKKQTDTNNSTGAKRITKFKYPVDYTTTGTGDVYEQALHAMRTTKHIYSPVIEKEIRELPSGQSEKLVAAELVKYKQFGINGQYFPHEIKNFFNSTALTDFAESNITSGVFTSDSRYQLQNKNEQYDSHGNPTLVYDATNTPTGMVWAYNSTLPIAQVRNATPSQATVSVFDDNKPPDGREAPARG